MKKLTIIGVVAAGVVAIGCAILASNDAATTVNQSKWQKKAPQLFNNVAYTGLTNSAPKLANLPESIEDLRGPITNPFGIRDDILEYIVKNIPSNNESAVRAAIKMMQYQQAIYFDNPSESEALVLNSKRNLSFKCAYKYLHQASNKDILADIDDAAKVLKLMRNNQACDNYMSEISRKYFSWKVLGTGLTVADEEIACQRGEF